MAYCEGAREQLAAMMPVMQAYASILPFADRHYDGPLGNKARNCAAIHTSGRGERDQRLLSEESDVKIVDWSAANNGHLRSVSSKKAPSQQAQCVPAHTTDDFRIPIRRRRLRTKVLRNLRSSPKPAETEKPQEETEGRPCLACSLSQTLTRAERECEEGGGGRSLFFGGSAQFSFQNNDLLPLSLSSEGLFLHASTPSNCQLAHSGRRVRVARGSLSPCGQKKGYIIRTPSKTLPHGDLYGQR